MCKLPEVPMNIIPAQPSPKSVFNRLRSNRKAPNHPAPTEEPVGYRKGNNATLESCS